MINEIIIEARYIFILIVILICGMFICNMDNNKTIHDQEVYESRFNTEFKLPPGWIIAATHGGSKK